MDANCAPISDNYPADVIETFYLYLNLDDLLNIDTPYFEQNFDAFYFEIYYAQ